MPHLTFLEPPPPPGFCLNSPTYKRRSGSAGSGTTAIAARKLGRSSVLIERDPGYAALAARRLQQLSLFAGEAS